MRYVFDTNGNNITSTAQSALMGASVLPMCNLYWLQYVNPASSAAGPNILVSNLFMTDAPYPVGVNKLQGQPGPLGVVTVNAVFQPWKIERGALEYTIGLEDQTLDVTWYTDDDAAGVFPGVFPPPWGWKWAMLAGYMDDCPMNVYTAFFNPPTGPNSAPTLLGTTLMWRGFIRDVKADRGQMTTTLSSLMHIFQNVQVPTQTIQPGNRVLPYATGTPTLFGNSLTGITPLVTSTPFDLQFTLTTGYPADHVLRDWYFTSHQQPPPNGWTPHSQQPGPQMYRIRDNIKNNNPVTNTLHVFPYEPVNPVTLVLPTLGTPTYMEIFSPQNPSLGGTSGFPYVPPPEVSL